MPKGFYLTLAQTKYNLNNTLCMLISHTFVYNMSRYVGNYVPISLLVAIYVSYTVHTSHEIYSLDVDKFFIRLKSFANTCALLVCFMFIHMSFKATKR